MARRRFGWSAKNICGLATAGIEDRLSQIAQGALRHPRRRQEGHPWRRLRWTAVNEVIYSRASAPSSGSRLRIIIAPETADFGLHFIRFSVAVSGRQCRGFPPPGSTIACMRGGLNPAGSMDANPPGTRRSTCDLFIQHRRCSRLRSSSTRTLPSSNSRVAGCR
jgi:hypothetical protein